MKLNTVEDQGLKFLVVLVAVLVAVLVYIALAIQPMDGEDHVPPPPPDNYVTIDGRPPVLPGTGVVAYGIPAE